MSTLFRYPGVKPFSQQESKVFFGRTDDIDKLARYLRIENLVVLHGKSGLGKTSMINAGILPLIQSVKESGEELNYTPLSIRFRSYTPKAPRYLFDVFSENVVRKEGVIDTLPVKTLNLWQVLKSRQISDGASLQQGYLLILDQFEELFTYPEKEVDAFGRQLADLYNHRVPADIRKTMRRELVVNGEMKAMMEKKGMKEMVESPVNVKILIAIRSDRFNLLDRFTDYLPEVMMNSLILEPFSRDQAKEAIEEPARIGGDFASPKFSYSAIASDKILDYLTSRNTKRVEGFQLQIICRNIEEKLLDFLGKPEGGKSSDQFHFHLLKESDQAEHAEVSDINADFGNILRRYYDEQIQRLGDEETIRAARVLIEEELIAEERRISLDRAIIKSLVSDELLEELVATRIIRREPNNQGGFSFEVSHDTLIEPILEAKADRMVKEEQEQRFLEARKAVEEQRAKDLKEQEERERKRELEIERGRKRTLISFLVVVIGLLVLLAKFWFDEERQGDRLALANSTLKEHQEQLEMQQDSLRQQQEIVKGFFGASDEEWDQLIEDWKHKDTAQVRQDIANFDFLPIIKDLEIALNPYPHGKWKILKQYDKLRIRLHVFSSRIEDLSGQNAAIVREVGKVLSKEAFKLYEVVVEVHTTTDRSQVIGPSLGGGNITENIFISANRAKNAADVLIQGGVYPSRVTILGAGPNRPVATTESNPEMSKRERNNINRRLELVLSVPKELE